MNKNEWKKYRGSGNIPDHVMLSLKSNPAHERTVTWRCCTSVDSGYVLYRAVGEEKWKRAEASVNHFTTDMDESNYFFADVKGMRADTEYEYTCGNDSYRCGPFIFRTSRENVSSFSFIALSDIQTGSPEPPPDYSFLGEFLKDVLIKHPEAEFILTAGDNTNCGQSDLQWCGLFEGLKGIIESIPLMMSVGNHDEIGFEDYYTGKGKYYSEYTAYFSNQFMHSYPENGPGKRKTANYSFDYGDAHFSVIGLSGYSEMNEWMKDDLDSSGRKWKFGIHHFPVCYSSDRLENEDTYPALRECLEKCDIVFSGHEHCFARSFPRRNDGLYDKPSEGTVHYNLGSGNRNPAGRGIVPKTWNCVTYPHEEKLSMYAVVTVDGDRCTLTSCLEGEKIVDSCTVDKGNDLIVPYAVAPVHSQMRLKFKGFDLGICCDETLPEKIGDIWYVSPGHLVGYIGGRVERTPGHIRVGIYGRDLVFEENSSTAVLDGSEIQLSGPCLRLAEGQLFAPVEDVCKALKMHPLYFEHNNFISIESEMESTPVQVQP